MEDRHVGFHFPACVLWKSRCSRCYSPAPMSTLCKSLQCDYIDLDLTLSMFYPQIGQNHKREKMPFARQVFHATPPQACKGEMPFAKTLRNITNKGRCKSIPTLAQILQNRHDTDDSETHSHSRRFAMLCV